MPTNEIRLEALETCIDYSERWYRRYSDESPTLDAAREELRLVLEVVRAAEEMRNVNAACMRVIARSFSDEDVNVSSVAMLQEELSKLGIPNGFGTRIQSALAALRSVR